MASCATCRANSTACMRAWGWNMDEPIWDPTVFTKNRDRLLNQDIAVEGKDQPGSENERHANRETAREASLMLPIVLEVS
jgi:hypothetical protein